MKSKEELLQTVQSLTEIIKEIGDPKEAKRAPLLVPLAESVLVDYVVAAAKAGASAKELGTALCPQESA